MSSDLPSRRSAAIALALVAPAPTVGAAMAFWIAPGPVGSIAYAIGKTFLYGLPLLFHFWIDRQPRSLSPARRGGFGPALLLGLGVAALIGGLWFGGIGAQVDPTPIREAATANGFDTPLRYLVVAAWLSLVNAALEEYSFRWFLYSRLRPFLAPKPAVVAAAIVFTVHHVVVLRAFFPWPLTLLTSSGVLVGGLIFSECYRRYESIWPGWLAHVIVDVAIMAIGWLILFG